MRCEIRGLLKERHCLVIYLKNQPVTPLASDAAVMCECHTDGDNAFYLISFSFLTLGGENICSRAVISQVVCHIMSLFN